MGMDQDIEQDIQARASKGPRITPADVEASIASEWFINAGDATGMAEGRGPDAEALRQVTICVLVLRNGHRVVGVNEGPVSTANFDAELGLKMARQKAVDQIWPLLGYQLRCELAKGQGA